MPPLARSSAVLVCACLSLFGCSNGQPTAVPELAPGYSATIRDDGARFLFPVADKSSWEWNRSTTQDNFVEYLWVVELQTGGQSFQFGFLLFKYPGSRLASGDLKSLLQAGQNTVASVSQQGFTALADARVKVLSESGYIVVIVDDPNTLQLLFAERPTEAVFRSVTPGNSPVLKKVELRYE